MIRILNIEKSTGLFDVPSFVLSENESLTIHFSFPKEIRVGRYFIVVRHGIAPKKIFVLSNDKSIELSSDWLNEGGTEDIEFSLELQNTRGTSVIKNDYCIEPLTVFRADGNFTYSAVVQQLTTRVEALEESLAEEIEVKREILQKLQDFADNGAELFPQEIK